MAGFHVHLIGGAVTGSFMAGVGMGFGWITPVQTGALFIIGTVAGLLPDLDSDTGKPLAFLFHLISVLIPALLLQKIIHRWGYALEVIICYFTIAYLFINYAVCTLIKSLTRHRGMMHSLPFCLLCAGIGYLLFFPSGPTMAVLAAITVFFGCLVHLVLDEVSALQWQHGRPVAKRSGGTALKFTAMTGSGTVLLYTLVFLVGAAVYMVAKPETRGWGLW